MSLARRVHRFLLEQRFYSVALLSVASCALLAARFVAGHPRELRFMLWNLTLAWIPYLCSFAAAAAARRAGRGRSLVVGLLALPWLAFFPNAPYLVTDLLHLRANTTVPAWYDTALFAAFALSGCLLGVASLRAMHRLIIERAGILVGHAAALLVIVLSAFGIYLGRVVRLNSWDIATRPDEVLSHAWWGAQSREGLLCTVLFAGFFAVCYAAFGAMSLRPRERREGQAGEGVPAGR